METAQSNSRDGGVPRLVHITTVPVSLNFIGGQPRFMRRRGFEVHAIAFPGTDLTAFGATEQIAVHGVAMPRQITPVRDLRALWSLVRLMRCLRPTIVHAHTPKGGLLAMIASRITGVPVRIYDVYGFPYMTMAGWRRNLLMATERLSCLLASRVFCVSPSLREVAVTDRICSSSHIRVLAHGSANGIDAVAAFNPGAYGHDDENTLRLEYNASPHDVVITFIGRLTRDKGIYELASAWSSLRERFPHTRLIVAGEYDEREPVDARLIESLADDPRVHLTGHLSQDRIRDLYAMSNLIILPTYREGFPNVLLEASAMAVPVVATRIPGCVDAVEDGVTGTLIPPRSAEALVEAIEQYLVNPERRRQHGACGRERVLLNFRQDTLWEAIYEEYAGLMMQKGLVPPSYVCAGPE